MSKINKYENKVLAFAVGLKNAYKDEEEREDVPKLELKEEELTEDFTAMLDGMFVIYKSITNDDVDLIGFTHILNRLAVQRLMNLRRR